MSLEQITKSRQLRITGLLESNNNDLKENLNFFQNSLSVQVGSIEFCTRVGQEGEGKDRPVVVAFGSMQERNDVFYNKRKLKGQSIVIREVLTKFKYGLYKYAREKFGIKTWTKNGRIIVHSEGKKLTVESIRMIGDIFEKTQKPVA